MTAGFDQQADVMVPKSKPVHDVLHAEVMIQCGGWAKLPDAAATIQKAIGTVNDVSAVHEMLEDRKSKGFAATIVLSDDVSVRQLNKTHRNIDKPTNVLSFPSAPEPLHGETGGVAYLGDIVIAFETVVAEAKDLERTVSDHLSHLTIHGLLHVLGYDHETDEDAREMEQLEISLLGNLNIANPYE